MIRSTRMWAVRLAALFAACAFVLGVLPACAQAEEPAIEPGYVIIGGIEVAKGFGITTEAELDALAMSSVPKTYTIDPETGEDVRLDLGFDGPEGHVGPEQAKAVMDGTKTLDEVLEEPQTARGTDAAAPVSGTTAPAVLARRGGVSTWFSVAGSHYGSRYGSHYDGYWPQSKHCYTGGWWASVDFTYKGFHNNTRVRSPHTGLEFGSDDLVEVTGVYMS